MSAPPFDPALPQAQLDRDDSNKLVLKLAALAGDTCAEALLGGASASPLSLASVDVAAVWRAPPDDQGHVLQDVAQTCLDCVAMLLQEGEGGCLHWVCHVTVLCLR